MLAEGQFEPNASRENPSTREDVIKILLERGWVSGEPTPEQRAFCERAAALLGPQAADAVALCALLELIFHYDATHILEAPETHAILARYGARNVVRELAFFLLDPKPFDSDRFKEVVVLLKEKLDLRGRDLFHPLRLVLAGRAGEGDLDRVILLLDEAAALPFDVRVKSARARILEFCAALD